MAHEAQVRYSNLVDLKLRKTLVKKVGVICNNRYEGSPKAGSVKVPVRDTEVVVNDYDKAKGAKQTSGDTTYLTVNIDHDKAVNEIIDGFDAESVPGNLVADRLDSAGYSLGLQMDSDGSVELTTAGTAFGNTTALTEKTIYANIVDARTQQSAIGVPTAGRWLRRSDSDVPMRICHRSNENTDSNLVVTGFPGTWIFTKRACTSIVKNENAEAAMRRLVSSMQPWPKLELGAAVGFDTTYTAQTSGGSIMDYLMTIGAACDLGFQVRLSGKNDQKKLLFEVYRPTADPNNRFSTKWGNLQQAAWAFGDSDYANVAIVQGAGEGDARATVTVGLTEATGADRRELYVDARDVQPDEEKGETTKSQAYLERLMARGTNKLLEQLRTGSIELTIDADGLSPGDVAYCTIPELGYKATVRVADVITQSQSDSTTRTVRLGTPVWRKL